MLKRKLQKIKDYLKRKGPIYIIRTLYKNIIPGYRVYLKICKKYGENITIFIGQHPGTGDVFLQSMFLEKYANNKQVKEYVFTVIGRGAYNIAQLYQIKNIEILTLSESNNLVRLYKFLYGKYNLNIDILHYHPMEFYYDEYLGYLRNYHRLNFYNMMTLAVFQDINATVIPPILHPNLDTISRIYKKYHLVPEKTILLAPYANSVSPIPISFWERIVSRLNELGYCICTNSFSANEPAIQGTCAVALSYDDLLAFLEMSGAVICLRSGLSDFISCANCKKIVLYPRQNLRDIMGGIGSTYQYFSLDKMGLCDDAIEYEFSIDNIQELKIVEEQIVKKFNRFSQMDGETVGDSYCNISEL